VADASGQAGDAEWQGAFNLASSINITDGGTVAVQNRGPITSFEQWRQARAEERKIEKAVTTTTPNTAVMKR